MRVPIVLLGALLLASSACTGRGINLVPPYKVQAGTITLALQLPPEQSDITEVEFFFTDANGGDVSIGKDSEGPEFAVQFDTTRVVDGINLIRAIGNPGLSQVVLLENSIFVRNGSQGTAAAFRLMPGSIRNGR
ncbi:MAG: hypothetical protein VKN33_05470 [Candidatus Sericytochromatia bacterium]|nr:hypothetical protein [Candidatus Sericytochromatia bacterium]